MSDQIFQRLVAEIEDLKRKVEQLSTVECGFVRAGDNMISGVTGKITDNTPTQVIAAQGAGVIIRITNILVTNGGTVGTDVEITDGSGGTVLWAGYAAASGGGFAIEFEDAPLELTANTAVYTKCEETADISVRVAVSGYKE